MITLHSVYDFAFNPDFSTKHTFGHPYVPPAIILGYIVFCKWLGPALMSYRKPFVLRNVLVTYNFFQVFVNGYIAFRSGQIMIQYWDDRCQPDNVPSYDRQMQENRLIVWHIYLSKFVDLLDTVFFVLRKKQKQISFLHIFHHAVICALAYIYVKRPAYGYYLLLSICLNCLVHVFMYLYYGLSAMGPHIQQYLWWKKHLTSMQIVQFLIILAYMTIHFINGCEKTGIVEIGYYFFVWAVLFLFLNFYRKSFNKKVA